MILVYADLHSYDRHAMVHREIAERLDPARFAPMRLDEALAGLARWSGGRVLAETTGGINERITWAALEGVPTRVPLALVSNAASDVRVRLQLRGAGRSDAVTVDVPSVGRATVDGLVLHVGHESAVETAELTLAGPWGADTRRPSVTAVPAGAEDLDGVREARFVGLWDAVSLNHGGGSIIEDPTAMWGRAWASPAVGAAGESCILFGPYVEAPAGRTLVAFRVRLEESVAPETTVAWLDVNTGGYEGLNVPLGRREVRAAAFDAVGAWQWLTTTLDWPGGLNRLETRLTWTGEAALTVDRVAAFALR